MFSHHDPTNKVIYSMISGCDLLGLGRGTQPLEWSNYKTARGAIMWSNLAGLGIAPYCGSGDGRMLLGYHGDS